MAAGVGCRCPAVLMCAIAPCAMAPLASGPVAPKHTEGAPTGIALHIPTTTLVDEVDQLRRATDVRHGMPWCVA